MDHVYTSVIIIMDGIPVHKHDKLTMKLYQSYLYTMAYIIIIILMRND